MLSRILTIPCDSGGLATIVLYMEKKSRVLLLLPHPDTDNFAESLVKSLREYDFTILAFNAASRDSSTTVWNDSNLIKFSGLRWRDLPFQIAKVSKLIHHVKPDVVHTTDYRCAIIASCVKLFTFSKIPFLLNRHYNKTHHDLNKKHVYIDRLIQKIASCVVVVSYAQKVTLTTLEKCAPKKVHVIHNGIERERLVIDEREISILREEFKRNSQFSLVAVGRIHSQKDYITLIKAMEKVRNAGYDVHLYVCGASNHVEQSLLNSKVVELGLLGNITFLGYVENALNFIKAADLFVQSSMDEAFGVSILEALFLRQRIAVTTPGGVIEFVSGLHEYLSPGDSEALAEKIILELDVSKSRCVDCLEERYKHLLSKFEFKVTAVQYGNLYRKLINQSV
jgi:glycosyltransferase involved in cell wall biosynthesis